MRELDLAPIVFDFEKPATRGFGETVRLLAGMSRFVIADLTDAAEVRAELTGVAQSMPRVPVVPLLLSGAAQYVTFETDIAPYRSVLPVVGYTDIHDLLAGIEARVINPANQLWSELTGLPL